MTGGFLILLTTNVITMWVAVHALDLASANLVPQVLGQTTTDKQLSPKEKVRQLLEVPDAEEPTEATIVDLPAVQKQNPSFYAEAKSGDTVLIYSTKAVIFRSETGKIVNIAPVTKAK